LNQKLSNTINKKRLKDKIKIKIIITEIIDPKNEIKRGIRKAFSPILSKLNFLPEFGMFHS
jgi:hypothetical protein